MRKINIILIFMLIGVFFLAQDVSYALRVPMGMNNKRVEGIADEFEEDEKIITELSEIYREWGKNEFLIDTPHKFKLFGLLGQLLIDEKGNGIIIVGDSGMGKTLISAEIFKRLKRSKFITDDFIIFSIIDRKIYAGYDPALRASLKGNHRKIRYRSKGSKEKDTSYGISQEQTHTDFVRVSKIVEISTDNIERVGLEYEVSNSNKTIEWLMQHLMRGRFFEYNNEEALLSQNLRDMILMHVALPVDRDKRFLELDKIIKAIMSNEPGGLLGRAKLPIDMKRRDVDSGI